MCMTAGSSTSFTEARNYNIFSACKLVPIVKYTLRLELKIII